MEVSFSNMVSTDNMVGRPHYHLGDGENPDFL